MYSENSLMRHLVRRMIGSLLMLAIIVTVWELVIHFMPGDWWISVVNIGFLLITALMAVSLKNQIRLLVSDLAAWLNAILAWVLLVIVLRSVESAILDALLG